MPVIVHPLAHFRIDADVDCHDDDENGDEYAYKDLGIYSSEANAEAAIERLKTLPGFRDWPNGFRIFRSRLDHDSWPQGFIRSDEA